MPFSRLLTFALLSSLAFGCAEAIHRPPAPTSPPPTPPTPKRKSMSFAVETDSPLYETALQAAEEWSLALGIPVTVSPEGDIPIFVVSELSCEVPPDAPVGGKMGACSPDVGGPSARIEVPDYLPRSYWRTSLLHEMGHHLRGLTNSRVDGGHHDDPNGLMYGGNVRNGVGITARDVAFVCEHELDCHPPGGP